MNYYVYIKTATDGTILYIGKGKGNRELSDKNSSYDWYAANHKVLTQRIAVGMTEEEAFTLEGQLIQKHSPMFNRTKGLSPTKWTDTDFAQFMESLYVRQKAAQGAESATPQAVAFSFTQQVLHASHIMLVGDRYSVMLEELLSRGYDGRISVLLEQGQGKMAKLEEICDTYEADIDIYAVDFLTADSLPQVDYVLMNPPFTQGKSPLWKLFLDKALSLASHAVYTLMPKRGALSLEHLVLIDTVEFESTPALGQAVCVQAGAKILETKLEQFKFRLASNFSEVRQGTRGGHLPTKFIGISRNKKESNCQLRSTLDLAEASMCIVHGPDIELVALLASKHNFEQHIVQFKASKAAKFGHAPSLTKQELVTLFNQLYDMEFHD